MKELSDILICSDFDGTLYNRCVSDEDAEAIRRFQELGGAFTLCTGRPPHVFEQKNVSNITLNAPMICLNGALIYDQSNGSMLYEEPLDDSIIPLLERLIKSCEGFTLLSLFPTDDLYSEYMHDAYDLESHLELLRKHKTYKAVFRILPEYKDTLPSRVADIAGDAWYVSRSWETGIEINSLGATKGASARRVADMLGRYTLICAGDFENDISMLTEADIGYAVANASDKVKKAADRVTRASVGGAIAEIIKDILNNN